jgi:hypothetical protein
MAARIPLTQQSFTVTNAVKSRFSCDCDMVKLCLCNY